MVIPAAGGGFDFSGSWQSAWSTISGSFSTLATVMKFVGIVLLLVAVVTYFWKKRKGGGAAQGVGPVIVAAVLGGILCAPEVLLPILLGIIDLILYAFTQMASSLFGV